MKATSFLMDEHKYILRALNVIEHMALRVERGETPDEKDVEDMLGFLRLFADNHHQVIEETVLFPAIVKASQPAQLDALKHMIFEHDQERSLVEGLEDALRTNRGKDFVYYVERLTHILRTHIYKEEHLLFEMVDSVLTSEDDERIASELADCDRPLKEKGMGSLLARLTALEWKYLGKVA
jgi:hemerythrin-like domain-containing protein